MYLTSITSRKYSYLTRPFLHAPDRNPPTTTQPPTPSKPNEPELQHTMLELKIDLTDVYN